MTAPKRRLVERVLDDDYAAGLAGRALDQLRTMREECREGENELSFERRLCHARIDILSAELQRRTGSETGGLVERLPQILGAEARGDTSLPLPERAPDYSVPRNADIPRRRVEEIVGEQTLARLAQLSVEEIKGIANSLAEHEREVSARRKRVQDVLDAIQEEIVRRYASGEADPSAALG